MGGDFILLDLNSNIMDELPFEVLRHDLEKGNHLRIIDFDLHFENCSLDFRNNFLKEFSK